MSQNSKRVYSGQDTRFLQFLSPTDYYVKEAGGQFSQLQDGLDQQQLAHTFQREQPSDAEQGLEQNQVHHYQPSESHQNSTGIVKFCEKGRGRRKRSLLTEEQKRERKRQIDAKYRNNKKLKLKRVVDENNMLKKRLKASEQAKETEPLSLEELLQDIDIMQSFSIVLEDESQKNLGQNQSVTYPQDAFHPQLPVVQSQSLVENQPIAYFQDDNQGIVSFDLQDNSQRPHSAVIQNDAGNSLEENQLLTQPQFVPACCLTFVEKLKRDERSSVSYSDFKTLLQGETQEFKGYRIPLVLQPILEQINSSHGDITSNSLLSSFSAENVLLQFLATIKQMGDTSFELVNEEQIFKWKDCIADAQRIKFSVDFAIEDFNKIVKSYLVRNAGDHVSHIDKRIQVLETELNDLKREKLEIKMFQSQLFLASEDFQGSVGLL
ncbi:hypothetical protein REPUB_Repub20aG0083300 [Reevesia pubescens]